MTAQDQQWYEEIGDWCDAPHSDDEEPWEEAARNLAWEKGHEDEAPRRALRFALDLIVRLRAA